MPVIKFRLQEGGENRIMDAASAVSSYLKSDRQYSDIDNSRREFATIGHGYEKDSFIPTHACYKTPSGQIVVYEHSRDKEVSDD